MITLFGILDLRLMITLFGILDLPFMILLVSSVFSYDDVNRSRVMLDTDVEISQFITPTINLQSELSWPQVWIVCLFSAAIVYAENPDMM